MGVLKGSEVWGPVLEVVQIGVIMDPCSDFE